MPEAMIGVMAEATAGAMHAVVPNALAVCLRRCLRRRPPRRLSRRSPRRCPRRYEAMPEARARMIAGPDRSSKQQWRSATEATAVVSKDKWSSKRAKTGSSPQRVRCAQRRRIKRLPLASMEQNEEPITESGAHFQ
jgi:hypothetical protein